MAIQSIKVSTREKLKEYSETINFSKNNMTNYVVLPITIFLILVGVIYLFSNTRDLELAYGISKNTDFGTVIKILGYTLLAYKIMFFGFVFYSFKKYKAVQSTAANEDLLDCSVIVPAYNEGAQVYKTLKSLVNSDYPKSKLSIYAVDDGSKDNTWLWMQKAKEEFGDQIVIYSQPKNKGKREALYRCLKIIKSEVVITVDSDSIVDKDTLRNMVAPFMADKNCGAVAGNVKILNKKGLIPKMLSVGFMFSFEFIRSAQSVFGTVLCTPGALSAYRMKAVKNCLEDWVNQKFMGEVSHIGEDRAMTNMILKQGYVVKFQSNANVYTEVPTKYKSLRKMFTRWERSNVRENIMMSKYVFNNFRQSNKTVSRIYFINQWVKLTFAIPTLLLMMLFLWSQPLLFLSVSSISILIFASIPMFFYFKKTKKLSHALYAYTYAIYFLFTLFWITPYAMLTPGQNSWLTR
ncbi:MAG: glycosyltransferase [Bacteroidetes bacterium]|jgi:hyaluronan synthase|nr:glycosyltransferase [Bacteroidota bacterium]